jgi:hypothetical protein
MGKIDKTLIYSWIFWISIGVIVVWIILKAYSIINTPTFVQFIPYIGAIFAAGSIFQIIRDNKRDLSSIKRRIGKMAVGLTRLEVNFDHIKRDVGFLRKDVEVLKKGC